MSWRWDTRPFCWPLYLSPAASHGSAGTKDGEPLVSVAPMQVYAPPTAASGKPRIAIVLSGLGIGSRATAGALELPPAVTLAFVPVAANVQQWVNEARRRGHEMLLQIPMEPYDYPDSDPGPNMMRVGQRQVKMQSASLGPPRALPATRAL